MTSSTRCILHWLSPFVGQLFMRGLLQVTDVSAQQKQKHACLTVLSVTVTVPATVESANVKKAIQVCTFQM